MKFKNGFIINDFGDRDLFIRGVPADLFGTDAKDLFIEILSELINVSPSLHIGVIEDRIATRACKAAVKGNQKISKDECNKLLEQMFKSALFDQAISDICERNKVRFADIAAKITHILRKDKLSVRERMKSLFQTIRRRGKMLFEELFAGKKTEKIDRIVSFLAILELLRSNKIECEQDKPFDSILIEEKR